MTTNNLPNRIFQSYKDLRRIRLYEDKTDSQLQYEWNRIRRFHEKARTHFVNLEEIAVYRGLNMEDFQ